MDRLTDQNQTQIDEWRSQHGGPQPGDPTEPGTSLKVDDHVLLAGFLPLVVFGAAPDSDGCFNGGNTEWFGAEAYPFLISDLTDRAGPNGEGMPVIDPVVPEEPQPGMAARSAATAPTGATQQQQHQAKGLEKQSAKRDLDALTAHMTPAQQKAVRHAVQKHQLQSSKK